MKYFAIVVENPSGQKFIERRKFRTRFMANIELADRMENACDGFKFSIWKLKKVITSNEDY